ncbi:MAG: hypothetical protein KIS96_15775, partial [Bauldia sp.]|nr:hypothetical protein [Bauldia sp.]
MAEYYALLTKAVGGLNPNTVDARRGVYDKARQALIAQLKAINPPLPAAVISKQRLELEEAVRRVEREAAAGVAAETGDISQAAARAMEEALAAGSDSGGASAWRPEPVRDPDWGAPPEPPPPPRRSAGQRIVEGAGRREPLAEDRSETVRAPQAEPVSRRRAEPVIDVEVADLDDVPPPPPPRGRAQPVRAAWADLEDASSGGAAIA